ncbi:hypothetical protein KL86APRO_11331 [uncultured Alphaproteobacteria bacterium]|uniref:Uncharacterized protein n=1 Tax=uncultured Alphaproteobacteria bacterium TaxID=91750 RepID=A0A212JMU6_9PROT|nr:hypothetical protein KL86APRO_11331 [uncultured Alphaproteobacteria bacterium]
MLSWEAAFLATPEEIRKEYVGRVYDRSHPLVDITVRNRAMLTTVGVGAIICLSAYASRYDEPRVLGSIIGLALVIGGPIALWAVTRRALTENRGAGQDDA